MVLLVNFEQIVLHFTKLVLDLPGKRCPGKKLGSSKNWGQGQI